MHLRISPVYVALGLALVGGSVAALVCWPEPRAPQPRASIEAPRPRATSAMRAQPVSPQPVAKNVLASTQVTAAPARATLRPGAAAPPVLPDRLDAVPMTPWREAQLARYTPQQREMLDYKLGLMARMRECAAAIDTEGKLNVFLHYDAQPGTGVAKGSGVDPIDSSLDRDADEAALDASVLRPERGACNHGSSSCPRCVSRYQRANQR